MPKGILIPTLSEQEFDLIYNDIAVALFNKELCVPMRNDLGALLTTASGATLLAHTNL